MTERRFLILLIIVICFSKITGEKLNTQKFPEDFLFGVATSSYQIEGAWNEGGKGDNIWDRLTHDHPEMIEDKSNGDIACDSYRHYKDDIKLIKDLGVNFYRFSLSWARILPTGLANEINQAGVTYYNDLIDEIVKNNITPIVTLYHWDLPQKLQDLGGWPNEELVDIFAQYANVCFDKFGDRVKTWLTFNEPINVCLQGYGGTEKAPALNDTGKSEYLCAHTLLKAHAKAYHLYNDNYRPIQKGIIGITLDSAWFEPATNETKDKEAAERLRQFSLGWYANPIFGPNGDYPEVMRKFVDMRSKQEGFTKSRLPNFSSQEIAYIKGTSDYFGFNAYTTRYVSHQEYPILDTPRWLFDTSSRTSEDANWPTAASPWLKVVPWGFRKILNWIKEKYGDVDIYVTENGYSDHGELEDYNRTIYFQLYLSAMLDAIHEDKVNVKGYTFWSLLDNFEWMEGYVNRFGLYHVDFNDPNRARTPKFTVGEIKSIISNWHLPNETYNGGHSKIEITSLLLIVTTIFIIIFN